MSFIYVCSNTSLPSTKAKRGLLGYFWGEHMSVEIHTFGIYFSLTLNVLIVSCHPWFSASPAEGFEPHSFSQEFLWFGEFKRLFWIRILHGMREKSKYSITGQMAQDSLECDTGYVLLVAITCLSTSEYTNPVA
jgi:hypothetical protein